MATIAVAGIGQESSKHVAPWGHTALLVAIFLGMAVSGAFFQRHARSEPGMLQQHPNVLPLYLFLIVMEWGLFAYVWRGGLRKTGIKLSEVIGGRWARARDILADVAIALGFWGIWMLFDLGWDRWLGTGHAASIRTYLPQRAVEILLWIGVCISAGICEEFAFRGYLQRQLEALTHRKWIALLLQALLFGIAHGYQGVEACAKIAVYGGLFGLLAMWRKSLRPGMIAHAWTDIVGGIVRI